MEGGNGSVRPVELGVPQETVMILGAGKLRMELASPGACQDGFCLGPHWALERQDT